MAAIYFYYMETWERRSEASNFKKSIIIIKIKNCNITVIRVDTLLGRKEKKIQKPVHFLMTGKKCEYNGYNGVYIPKKGIFRWFSVLANHDTPLFKWVPIESNQLYNTKYPKNHPIITHKPVKTDDVTRDVIDDVI